jgi:hypothetical protein
MLVIQTIEQFAETYRVKTRKDSCGEVIIPGKPRKTKRVEDKSHIYENGDSEVGRQFGLCLMNPLPYPESKAKYTNAKGRLLAAGFIQSQDGDSEGTFLFDPSNPVQAKLAIREAGIKIARTLSPERLLAMKAHGQMLANKRWQDKQADRI